MFLNIATECKSLNTRENHAFSSIFEELLLDG
jgi:uncharacterized SAM-binding protein YcdF (DUF218 family)